MLSALASTNWDVVLSCPNIQLGFDSFYSLLLTLYNDIYPLQHVTVTSRDPAHITPSIKAMLRRRNKLLRRGRDEQAGALGLEIGRAISRFNSGRLRNADLRAKAKDVWATVRDITGAKSAAVPPPGVDSEALNAHFAASSTDTSYQAPLLKSSCTMPPAWPSERTVFHCLDNLRITAAGPDMLPSWLLKLAAPFISAPIAHLFRLSISTSSVPSQWLLSTIVPIPKSAQPTGCSDYRPISLTPILSRVLEKLLVRRFIYPSLLSPCPPSILSVDNQFAFRPSGSTTAALIAILKHISDLLESSPYVHLIALDFSKAFDTVRHATLFEKLAQFPLPDCIFNWLVRFFSGRSHQTKFLDSTSSPCIISASVIQGSAVGPAAFIANASDLFPSTTGNVLVKYADDVFLIVPSSLTSTIPTELAHISSWATSNNLRLNPTKTHELLVSPQGPPP